MYIIIFLLTVCCILVVFLSVRTLPDGRRWATWDAKRKINYAAKLLSALKRRGNIIKHTPAYYVNELDIFYAKDVANIGYYVADVLHNLIHVHEHD